VSYVVTADCTACGACLLTCPEHAIVAGLPLRVRDDRCTSCGECVEVCPADAVVEVPSPGAGRTAVGPIRGDHALVARTASVADVSELHDRALGTARRGDPRALA
jgi:MinD superfamily P-loop ATPase